MNEGLVSVIMPCYNGEEFLGQALKSVQMQTYPHWECIFVDDGSVDHSATIFQSLGEKDPRFRYHRQQNAGPSNARNTGIGLARGEFIQFLDDDDIIPENRLQLCVGAFRAHPDADVVYTDYVCYQNGEGFFFSLPARIPDGDVFLRFLCEQNKTFVVLMHSLIFKKQIIDANKFDTTLRFLAEDVECWTRIAEAGACFHYVDEVLAIYRYTKDSLAQDEAALLKAKVDVLKRYVDHPIVKANQKQFDEAMNYFQEHYAIGCFMKKDFHQGNKAMVEQLARSNWKGGIKMLGWFVLMIFFSRERIVKVRGWIVRRTPFKWGGWKYYRQWTPPESIQKLMFS